MRLRLVSLVRRLLPRALVPDVAIHGRHSPDWNSALAPGAAVWTWLAGLAQPATGEARWWRKRVVIPLLEPHIASMPGGCHALVPESEALAILADKARFQDYAAEVGAAHLLPRAMPLDRAAFPAVLKRTNLNAGHGVAFVTSQAELEARLASAPWAGEAVVLQEAIASRRDYVTHIVCVEGRIVWHCTYLYPLEHRRDIRGPVRTQPLRRSRASAADLRAFEQLLRPLGYSGPANIDYRRRPDGSLAIFEINPRLGGSLMRGENVADLAGCLRSIIRHARWRPVTAPAGVAAGDEARA